MFATTLLHKVSAAPFEEKGDYVELALRTNYIIAQCNMDKIERNNFILILV